MAVLEEIQSSIERIGEQVGPAVVGLGRGWGVGSGVVIGEGRMLTNAHVIRREEVTVTFADGRTAQGQLRGVDADADLAAVAVDTAGSTPVAWAPDGDGPAVGTPVFALGNPGGRGLSVSLGFVSAAGRSLRGRRGRRLGGAIEHTAALPRGSSGGPIVDAAGNLLGINTLRLDGGLILALPADATLRERAEALSAGESRPRVRLGIVPAPARAARRLRREVGLPDRDGVLVRVVAPDSAAARAGLERGDLIVAAGARPIAGLDDLYEALEAAEPGATLELDVVRGADERRVTVTLDG